MTTRTVLAGRYHLLRPLGRGGMGTVWLGEDEVLHRPVAVKEVAPPPGLTAEERDELRRRTLREARAAARLSHPNVVRVYDVVDSGDRPWLVMEYVPARSLHEVLNEEGPVTPSRAAAIGLSVLDALRAAHTAGVTHRDVKPGNVLLADDGRVVLTDFGLATVPGEASVTRPGLILGSPAYLAPERARGEAGGPESDLWSLGATLYTAVEGRSPFDRDSIIGTLNAVTSEAPDPARRAGRLGRVIEGLLQKDPRRRLDAATTERMLRRVAAKGDLPRQRDETPTVVAAPAARVEAPGQAIGRAPIPVPGAARRGRLRWLLVLAALVALVVAAFVALPRDTAPRPQSQPPANTTPSAAEVPPPATPGAESTPTPVPPAATEPPSSVDQPGTPVIPAGWRLYTDRTGFAVAVPRTWRVSRSGTIVYFREPGGARVLGIDQTDQPKSDPVADWTAQESYRVRRGDFPQYERIKIAPCDFFVSCADWEFRYTRNGVRTHVNNRGFVVSSNLAHGIWWSTPESQWTASLSMLETVFRTFKPAR
jgi:hypothetical protein